MKYYDIKLKPYDFNIEKEVEVLLKEGYPIETSIRLLIARLTIKADTLILKKDEFHRDMDAYSKVEKGSEIYNGYFQKYDQIDYEDLIRSIYRTDAFIDNQVADIKCDIMDLHAYYGAYLIRQVSKTISDLKQMKQEEIELLEEKAEDVKDMVGEYIIAYDLVEKMQRADKVCDDTTYTNLPEVKEYKDFVDKSLFVSRDQAYQVWLKCIHTLTRIKKILNKDKENSDQENVEKQ